MNWSADTVLWCLRTCQGTAGCLGPGDLCKRRGESCYQGMAVKQRSRSWFWYYTCSAVAGQQKDVASGSKTQARIPVSLVFFWNFWHREHSKLSTVPPWFFIDAVITKLFSFDLLFYRGFSQHAVPLDLGVITNHILRIGHLACIPISSCL